MKISKFLFVFLTLASLGSSAGATTSSSKDLEVVLSFADTLSSLSHRASLDDMPMLAQASAEARGAFSNLHIGKIAPNVLTQGACSDRFYRYSQFHAVYSQAVAETNRLRVKRLPHDTRLDAISTNAYNSMELEALKWAECNFTSLQASQAKANPQLADELQTRLDALINQK